MTTVGMLGLGIMGSAMSGHLLARGFDVVGYDPLPERAAALSAAGGHAEQSVEVLSRRCDFAITSLPSASAALDVCARVATSGPAGLTVVETSTLPMDVKQQCRRLLADARMTLLDCPLSGTGAQALERDLVVLGSGDEDAFEAVRPVLEAFARSVRYLGEFGRGSTMKFVANLLVAIHNVATAEAFALGERAGLDPAQILDVIQDGAGSSVIFEKRGLLMARRQYQPPSAKLSMFLKDVDVITAYAEELDLPTPMLSATRDLYRRAIDHGLADDDAAALLTVMGSDRIGSHHTPAQEDKA
ncbi:NAD(P)-dependent oxidoreductase [Sphaerisporangium perillae]|uniref:NAD(P)-dependent oxidoreductase n=1 Tax=Sphaerisporangium perillae TaxID=2935860 RepID=UPI00200C2215|nr:NAD(P)-dependent oxidoreductase [Sphaerisporangium perillae]